MTENRASKRRLRWLPETAILVVWTTSIFGLVWSASTERANVLSQVHAQSLQMIDHEGRLRALEKQASEIAADVRWIRQTLEHHASKP